MCLDEFAARWEEFPSPCGVLVLKYDGSFRYVPAWDSFRPLAGFWFLNFNVSHETRRTKMFPSPCGVLVLKLNGSGQWSSLSG